MTAGIALLLVALVLGASLRFTLPSEAGDLRPRPDALEYEEAARNLIDGDGYCLVVDGGRYPPRYPYGFSLLLLPALWVADAGPGTGVLVVLALALGAIVATWRLAGRAGLGAGAGVAALFLALSPAHITSSRMVMSDVPASCAVAALGLATLRAATAAPSAWALLGAAIGVLATLRASILGMTVAGLLVIAASHLERRARAARAVALGAGLGIGLLPMLAFNAIRFGSPLRDGYGFWLGDARFFSLAFAFDRPVGGGSEANLVYYARVLAGLGDLYPWPIAVLALLGTIVGLRGTVPLRRLAVISTGFVVSLAAVYSFFLWQDSRLLMPAVPLICAVAAIPLAPGTSRPTRLAAIVLVGLGLALGFAERSPPLKRVHEPEALRRIAELVEPDAAVLVRTNGALFRRLVRVPDTDRVWLPLAPDEHQLGIKWYRLRPYARAQDTGAWIRHDFEDEFVAARAEQTIVGLLREGRPVYLSTLLAHHVPFLPPLTQLLRTRFVLQTVDDAFGWPLYRVRERDAHLP